MKGVSQGARRKAAASASGGKPKGKLEGRGRETLAGMKGWRPSAAKARNRIGLFSSGRISAGHRIDRPVFIPVLGLLVRGRQGFPFRAHEAQRPPSRAETAPERPRSEKAPALHLLQETGGPENKDHGEPTSGRTSAPDAAHGRLQGGKRRKK